MADQLHRLAGILGLPSSSNGSSTRQLIEGKLLEMGKESRNVQVIVSGESIRLYLVTDDGVIATEPKLVSNTDVRAHTTNEFFNNKLSVHELESLRSALCEAHLENTRLANELHDRDKSLEVLHGELLTANNEIVQLSVAAPVVEVEALRKNVKTQTAKAKRFWSQKCEQLLAHEAAIEDKDECITAKNTEIARLQSELQNLRDARTEPHGTDPVKVYTSRAI